MDAALNSKERIAAFRTEFTNELQSLAREFIDVARAEGTSQAYERVFNTAMKSVPDVAVDTKGDKYANLPVINFVIGPGMQVTTTVEAAQAIPVLPADVVDVQAKSPFGATAVDWNQLPADPLELLDTPEEKLVRDSLDAAAGAMALPD